MKALLVEDNTLKKRAKKVFSQISKRIKIILKIDESQ